MLNKIFDMMSWVGELSWMDEKVDEPVAQALAASPPIYLRDGPHSISSMRVVIFGLIVIVLLLLLALSFFMIYVGIFDSNNELYEKYFTWEAIKKIFAKIASLARKGFAKIRNSMQL